MHTNKYTCGLVPTPGCHLQPRGWRQHTCLQSTGRAETEVMRAWTPARGWRGTLGVRKYIKGRDDCNWKLTASVGGQREEE